MSLGNFVNIVKMNYRILDDRKAGNNITHLSSKLKEIDRQLGGLCADWPGWDFNLSLQFIARCATEVLLATTPRRCPLAAGSEGSPVFPGKERRGKKVKLL